MFEDHKYHVNDNNLHSSHKDICKKCNELCDPYSKPALLCSGGCNKKIHIKCLSQEPKRVNNSDEPIKSLLGDVFFELQCSQCNDEETISYPKLSWFKVVVLTLYNLQNQSDGISVKGYFHWNSSITNFIEKNWSTFFGSHVKQKKNWKGTISGTLSHYNGLFFKSGTTELGDAGWWKLMDADPPEIIVAKKVLATNKKQINAQSKIGVKSNASPVPSESSLSIGEDSNNEIDTLKNHNASLYSQTYVQPTEILSDFLLSEDDLHDMDTMDIDQSTEFNHYSRSLSLAELIKDIQNQNCQSEQNDIEASNLSDAFDFNVNNTLDEFTNTDEGKDNEYEEQNCDDSDDSQCSTKISIFQKKHVVLEDNNTTEIKEKNKNIETNSDDSNDIFNANQENVPVSLFTTSVSRDWPWKKSYDSKKVSSSAMSEQEETYLLQQIEKHKDHLDSAPKSIKRLYRKLIVRKLKRENSLPLLDIDRFGVQSNTSQQLTKSNNRVLDRFFTNNICGTFEQRLQGYYEPTSIYSPHTYRILKPFIRRDTTSRPLWLKVMEELLAKTNKGNPNWSLPHVASIDYSYVRPQHIPAINSLCNQFFWPGIDMTECLKHPDFTCVVLYKKLVIGFAVLVPDISLTEAYISFILTRPEWRNAKIGTFMLYHLIQTCMNKDITLHVSASSTAMFLYNKFGFKIDEFVRDFYDKYLPPNSRESRHAFLLRLSR